MSHSRTNPLDLPEGRYHVIDAHTGYTIMIVDDIKLARERLTKDRVVYDTRENKTYR